MHRQRIVIMLVAAAGMMASFLPWIKTPIHGTIYGTEAEGMYTFVLYLISFAMCCLGDKTIPVRSNRLLATVIPAIIASIIGAWKLFNFNPGSRSAVPGGPGTVTPTMNVNFEAGLHLVIIAGILLTIFALVLNIRPKNVVKVEKKINVVIND